MKSGGFAASAAILLAGASSLEAATTFTLVADNDFAVLAGTETSVTRIVYQNDAPWFAPGHLGHSVDLDLLAGENTFYVLAMGGGLGESLSGTINGDNIVQLPSVEVSSTFSGLLSGYNLGAIAAGTYNPTFTDVQSAYPGLTWSAPTVINDSVINANPAASIPGESNKGFDVPGSDAVLFRFGPEVTGVAPIPEPSSSLAVCALLALGFMSRSRRG